jgi:hypothetical protein
MAMPNRLIAVDIVCRRLCVLILNSGWFHQLQRRQKPRVSGNQQKLKRNCSNHGLSDAQKRCGAPGGPRGVRRPGPRFIAERRKTRRTGHLATFSGIAGGEGESACGDCAEARQGLTPSRREWVISHVSREESVICHRRDRKSLAVEYFIIMSAWPARNRLRYFRWPRW